MLNVQKCLVALVPVLLLTACSSVNPDLPDVTDNDTWIPPKQPESQIDIPIGINLRPYFRDVEQKTPTKFEGSEQTCEGVSYDYTFLRKPINFSAERNAIQFNVDGKYALKLNYCPQCTDLFSSAGSCVIPRIYASCGVGEPMRNVNVAYQTKIELTKKYALKSETQLKSVKATSPCKITVFQYNATDKIEDELELALQKVEKDIDREISAVDLRPEIEKVWKSMLAPMDLSGYGFMKLNPERLSLSKINFERDSAFFNVSVTAKPMISFTDTSVSQRKLPDLDDYKPNSGFFVTLDFNAQYDSLSAVITKAIQGQRLVFKKKEIQLEEVTIFGANAKRISLAVRFSGSKKGVLYLDGTPEFDSSSQRISFPDLDFNVKTKSALLKSAKWLFDEKVTEKLRQAAVFEMKAYLDAARIQIISNLNGEITQGVSMHGDLSGLELTFIHPANKQLFIRLQAKGNLRIVM